MAFNYVFCNVYVYTTLLCLYIKYVYMKQKGEVIDLNHNNAIMEIFGFWKGGEMINVLYINE